MGAPQNQVRNLAVFLLKLTEEVGNIQPSAVSISINVVNNIELSILSDKVGVLITFTPDDGYTYMCGTKKEGAIHMIYQPGEEVGDIVKPIPHDIIRITRAISTPR